LGRLGQLLAGMANPAVDRLRDMLDELRTKSETLWKQVKLWWFYKNSEQNLAIRRKLRLRAYQGVTLFRKDTIKTLDGQCGRRNSLDSEMG